MSAFIHDDVAEQILIRLDVKDLIRYKSVCKSWHSLITSSRFINRHVKHNYNKDCCNNELGHRRIVLDCGFLTYYRLVGSSNGLVCIIYGFNYKVSVGASKVLVVNPLTREVRHVNLPPCFDLSRYLCWGFGYDSFVDDYKVVVSGWKDTNHQTCVQVFSLKSNVWKDIGKVKYSFITRIGILWNGALHWIVRDQNYKKLIISCDLYNEELKQIPQPNDAIFEFTISTKLGFFKECLCLYHRSQTQDFIGDIWMMKNYNLKQSWKLQSRVQFIKDDGNIVRRLRSSNEESIFLDDASWFINTSRRHGFSSNLKHIINAPIFVESLVSPHVNAGPSNNKMSAKLIKGDSGPNACV